MLNTIGDSLSDLASPDDGEDGDDEDDDEEHPAVGKLGQDDKPGWVIGRIFETVQYRMEHFRQKHMTLDELTQQGWGDEANYVRQRDKKYGMTKLKVPAVVQPHTTDNAALSVPTTFGEPIESLDRVPGEWQMPQATSRLGSSHMRLSSRQRQTCERIPSLPPILMPDWSPIQQSKHDEHLSFNPCISHLNLITILQSDSDEDMVTAPASPEE